MAAQRPPSGANTVKLDSSTLATLAHPMRSRLLAELRTGGPSTATILASRMATNSGATSYHLRQLHEAGLVEEVPDRNRGRERWWQSAHDYTSIVEPDFDDDPDDRAAIDWLMGHYLRSTTRLVEDWMESRRDWSDGWRRAADHSDYQLHLTSEGLSAMRDEIHEVIDRHITASEATPRSSQSATVTVIVHAFPRPSDPTAEA